MGKELWHIVRMDVPCTACGKTNLEPVIELINNSSITCSFCENPIDISTPEWRSIIEQESETLLHINKT